MSIKIKKYDRTVKRNKCKGNLIIYEIGSNFKLRNSPNK